MKIQYIAQPNVQLGRIILEFLDSEPLPNKVILISAFVGLQTIMRIKGFISDLKTNGSFVRFILGIDMGGTSQEVLREVCSWDIEVKVFKHRLPGHTFHPKLYLFEWEDHAEIIIGSNNITEGGFFRNYEGSARVHYNFPADTGMYESAKDELELFLDPSGQTVKPLTRALLNKLIARGEVPTESAARSNRDIFRRQTLKGVISVTKDDPLFGTEDIPSPPPLPSDILEGLLKNVRRRRREMRRKLRHHGKDGLAIGANLISDKEHDVIAPAAFYMTLPTLQGPNIPGEGRIPLEAIELAQEFWGWPDEYERKMSPRAGKNRVYWNWKPKWKVWSVENPEEVKIPDVRMYMYDNSSDFRFYVRPLVNAGADFGDVVRIRRLAQVEAEYECVLARKGTAEFNSWEKFCTQPVRNSLRRFGYT